MERKWGKALGIDHLDKDGMKTKVHVGEYLRR